VFKYLPLTKVTLVMCVCAMIKQRKEQEEKVTKRRRRKEKKRLAQLKHWT
jgi:heme exporter protein D